MEPLRFCSPCWRQPGHRPPRLCHRRAVRRGGGRSAGRSAEHPGPFAVRARPFRPLDRPPGAGKLAPDFTVEPPVGGCSHPHGDLAGGRSALLLLGPGPATKAVACCGRGLWHCDVGGEHQDPGAPAHARRGPQPQVARPSVLGCGGRNVPAGSCGTQGLARVALG